jgi:hypothetical protein
MADERTPSDRASVLLRRRAERELLLKEARSEHRAEQSPPDWEDNEEPSVTKYVEGHDGRVSIEGLGPDVAEVVKAYKQKHTSIYARAKESIAPASRAIKTPKGQVIALLSVLFSALVAALLNELAKRGVAVP